MKRILHSYRRCPFCIRTRILLYLKGIEYEVVEEPLREWTPWMVDWTFATGERPRVPVLRYVLDAGVEKIMPESNEINLFIDTINGNPEYTPEPDTAGYAEMFLWWQWCAEELKPTIDLYKYGANLTFDAGLHTVHTAALHTHMEKLEQHLGTRIFLIEERLTLTDIAIIPFVRQIMRTREGEFDFEAYPRVVAWTEGIIEATWFKNIMSKKS